MEYTTLGLSENRNINENIERILKNIEGHIDGLAQKVDMKKPGDIFGRKKADHCKKLAEQSGSIAQSEKLGIHEAGLLRIILLSHDIGRFIEALGDFDTLRAGIRHGILSANYLKENNLLDGLDTAEKQIILQAIIYHSERTVDLDPESLSYRLCYILRDYDKLEIQEDQKYLDGNGVLEQLIKHYGIQIGAGEEGKYTAIISKLIADSDGVILDNTDEETKKIGSIMKGGVNPTSLEEFYRGNTTSVKDIGYSYATYMLNSISHIFDVSSNIVLEQMLQSDMFAKRLKFIQIRVAPETYSHILETIRDYCFRKGINTIATQILSILQS